MNEKICLKDLLSDLGHKNRDHEFYIESHKDEIERLNELIIADTDDKKNIEYNLEYYLDFLENEYPDGISVDGININAEYIISRFVYSNIDKYIDGNAECEIVNKMGMISKKIKYLINKNGYLDKYKEYLKNEICTKTKSLNKLNTENNQIKKTINLVTGLINYLEKKEKQWLKNF